MKRKNIDRSHGMLVQPAFIVGTYNEDGTPDFAPITWVSSTCDQGDNYLIVISMWGTKMTKQNTMRTGQLTLNLVSTDMLTLMDYFGQTSAWNGAKNALPYTYEKALFVDAPTLDCSRWVYECEVVKTVNTGESDTFYCQVKNVQADETVEIDPAGIDLTRFDPVIYSGLYHSIGKNLGRIGDYYKVEE